MSTSCDCVTHRTYFSLSMQSMTVPATSEAWAGKAHKELHAYVNQHPHCADLALPVWAIAVTSHATEVGKEVGSGGKIPVDSIKSVGENKVGDFFPATSAPPPIWVNLPGIDIVGGVELAAYPASSGQEVAHPRGSGVTQRKVLLSAEMSSACVTDLARILGVGPSKVPAAAFKSTVANTHWIW